MDFITELTLRLFGKTPVFFKIVAKVSMVAAFITILPTILTQIGLDLPDVWDTWILKAVSIASVVSAFIAKLTLTEPEKKRLKIE